MPITKTEWAIYKKYQNYGKNNFLIYYSGILRHYSIIKILNSTRFIENCQILDLGCGNGAISRLLANIGDVTGIDISSDRLKGALDHCSNFVTNKKVNFICSDIRNMPFSERSFDIIVIASVLEHLTYEDLGKLCADIFYLLKQNGYLICSYPLETKGLKFMLKHLWPQTNWTRDPNILGNSEFYLHPDTHKTNYKDIRFVLNNYFTLIIANRIPFNLPDAFCYYEVALFKKN